MIMKNFNLSKIKLYGLLNKHGNMITVIICLLLSIMWTIVNGQNCTCGKETSNVRIVGGQESKPNTHLWAAALITSFKNEIFCGGSLINNKYILTAAHCLSPFVEDEIRVALGIRLLSTIKYVDTIYDVEQIIIHPNYHSDDLFQHNDIAILKLNKDVEFTSKIQPICLPNKTLMIDKSKSLLVVGWGKMSEDGEFSDKLREVYLPYVDLKDCVDSYNDDLITNAHICAGVTEEGKEKDSCYGDSGGGLIYWPNKTKGYQVGIVSWGIECGSKKPGVYTRISSHMDWINEQTQDAIKCY